MLVFNSPWIRLVTSDRTGIKQHAKLMKFHKENELTVFGISLNTFEATIRARKIRRVVGRKIKNGSKQFKTTKTESLS